MVARKSGVRLHRPRIWTILGVTGAIRSGVAGLGGPERIRPTGKPSGPQIRLRQSVAGPCNGPIGCRQAKCAPSVGMGSGPKAGLCKKHSPWQRHCVRVSSPLGVVRHLCHEESRSSWAMSMHRPAKCGPDSTNVGANLTRFRPNWVGTFHQRSFGSDRVLCKLADPLSATCGPTSSEFRLISAKCAWISTKVAPRLIGFGPLWPTLAEFVQVGPTPVNFGSVWPTTGRIRAQLAEIGAFCQCRAKARRKSSRNRSQQIGRVHTSGTWANLGRSMSDT